MLRINKKLLPQDARELREVRFLTAADKGDLEPRVGFKPSELDAAVEEESIQDFDEYQFLKSNVAVNEGGESVQSLDESDSQIFGLEEQDTYAQRKPLNLPDAPGRSVTTAQHMAVDDSHEDSLRLASFSQTLSPQVKKRKVQQRTSTGAQQRKFTRRKRRK